MIRQRTQIPGPENNRREAREGKRGGLGGEIGRERKGEGEGEGRGDGRGEGEGRGDGDGDGERDDERLSNFSVPPCLSSRVSLYSLNSPCPETSAAHSGGDVGLVRQRHSDEQPEMRKIPLSARAPRACARPRGPLMPERQGGRQGGGRGSGQGQPRCLVSASREEAAMRSLVRRHRGFTWPLRRTGEAPRPLQSILCDCPRGRRSRHGRTRACLQQLRGEHRQADTLIKEALH